MTLVVALVQQSRIYRWQTIIRPLECILRGAFYTPLIKWLKSVR